MSDTQTSDTAQKSDWQLLRRVWPYVKIRKKLLWIVAFAMPLGVLGQLAQPILLKAGIDDYIAVGDLDGLANLVMLFVGVVMIGFSARSIGQWALQLIGLKALAKLRRDLYVHVMSQGQSFYDTRTTGALMTRTTNDVEAVYESLIFGAVGLITDALMIVGTAIAMLILDWKLTLIAFSIAPLIIFIVDRFRKRLRTLFTHIRELLSRLNGLFAEQIQGMKVVQLFGAEAYAHQGFRSIAYTYLDTYRRANWWDAGLYAIMDGLSALSIALMLAYGAYQFGVDPADGITLGLLIAFVDYLNKVFVPIREFSGRFAMIQRAVAALERVFGLLDHQEKIGEGTTAIGRAQGHIRFDHVTFAYGTGDPVLRDVSFTIKPGEVVAIVGATGSGKSTLSKLLLRTYDGYAGSIELDGHELRDVQLTDVRANVIVVHQDPYLFEASVAENISLWNPKISAADVQAAAEQARATDFVDSLAGRYEYVVTERGGNLSSGQKQLLSIARAMARDTPIIILDEATASVDSLTEKRIDEAVEALFADKTVLVIAHRLSTITKADRILVLHQGRLVEQGTHEDLIAQGGRYTLLVESGFAL